MSDLAGPSPSIDLAEASSSCVEYWWTLGQKILPWETTEWRRLREPMGLSVSSDIGIFQVGRDGEMRVWKAWR